MELPGFTFSSRLKAVQWIYKYGDQDTMWCRPWEGQEALGWEIYAIDPPEDD